MEIDHSRAEPPARPMRVSLLVAGVLVFLAAGKLLISDDDSNRTHPLYRQGVTLIEEGILLDGTKNLRSYLEEYPRDWETRLKLAELLINLGFPLNAAYDAQKVLDQQPRNERAQDVFERASLALEAQAEDEPGEIDLALARLYRAVGQTSDADRWFKRYLSANGENTVARAERAQMLFDAGDKVEAYAEIARATAIEPGNYQLRRQEAMWLFFDDNQQEAALPVFERLARDFPDSAEAHAHLGDLYRFKNRLDEASTSYRRANRLDPDNERALDGYFEILLLRRPLERAREANMRDDHKEAARLYALHFEELELTRRNLREVRAGRTNHSPEAAIRAAQYHQRFLDRSPPEVDIRREYAQTLSFAGDYSGAVEQLRIVVEKDPSDRQARRTIARYLTYSEDSMDDAEDAINELIAENPEDYEAQLMLARVARYRGDLPRAYAIYETALNINPDSAEARQEFEDVKAVFRPEASVALAGIFDYSVKFRHFWWEPRVKVFLRAAQHRLDVAYRWHFFGQRPSRVLQQFRQRYGTTEEAHRILFSMRGVLRDRWTYYGEVAGIWFEQLGFLPTGKIYLTYAEPSFQISAGLRRQEAVDEHYNINSLFSETVTNDIVLSGNYRYTSEDWWERWGVLAQVVGGYFSDDNKRLRVDADVTNRMFEEPDYAFDIGLGGRFQAYRRFSRNYFSPDRYTGIGPVARWQKEESPTFRWGLEGKIFYLIEDKEFDFAVGGFMIGRLSDDIGWSLRGDYGESTFSSEQIRTMSGVLSLQMLF